MTKKHRFNLHIPLDLWQEIKELASKHRRSITQEILLAIEKHVRDYKDGDNASS
jgi:hypothetical protein